MSQSGLLFSSGFGIGLVDCVVNLGPSNLSLNPLDICSNGQTLEEAVGEL